MRQWEPWIKLPQRLRFRKKMSPLVQETRRPITSLLGVSRTRVNYPRAKKALTKPYTGSANVHSCGYIIVEDLPIPSDLQFLFIKINVATMYAEPSLSFQVPPPKASAGKAMQGFPAIAWMNSHRQLPRCCGCPAVSKGSPARQAFCRPLSQCR